jgi:hypothetical protein
MKFRDNNTIWTVYLVSYKKLDTDNSTPQCKVVVGRRSTTSRHVAFNALAKRLRKDVAESMGKWAKLERLQTMES